MASVSRMLAQELVAQAFALRRARHQAGDVDEFDDRVGTMRSGLTMSASASRRGSGTSTMPTFGSMVQNG